MALLATLLTRLDYTSSLLHKVTLNLQKILTKWLKMWAHSRNALEYHTKPPVSTKDKKKQSHFI